MSAFLRMDALLQKPTRMMGEMRAGRLTQADANAVRDSYPKLFEQMQKTAMETITEAKQPLPYEKRKMVGLLLGIPADPTLEPDFVRDIQMGYSREPTEPQPGTRGPPRGHGRPPRPGSVTIAQRTDSDVARASSPGDIRT